jgi:hypothetical protein
MPIYRSHKTFTLFLFDDHLQFYERARSQNWQEDGSPGGKIPESKSKYATLQHDLQNRIRRVANFSNVLKKAQVLDSVCVSLETYDYVQKAITAHLCDEYDSNMLQECAVSALSYSC